MGLGHCAKYIKIKLCINIFYLIVCINYYLFIYMCACVVNYLLIRESNIFTSFYLTVPTATNKGAELSCEIDYTISFWSWILSWKSLNFVEISTFRGYYMYFVEISTFRGYYPHFVDISALRGYYPHFMDIIYIYHITSYLACNFRPIYFKFNHLVKVTGASLIFLFVT